MNRALRNIEENCCDEARSILDDSQGRRSEVNEATWRQTYTNLLQNSNDEFFAAMLPNYDKYYGHPRFHVLCEHRKGENPAHDDHIRADFRHRSCADLYDGRTKNKLTTAFLTSDDQNQVLHETMIRTPGIFALQQLNKEGGPKRVQIEVTRAYLKLPNVMMETFNVFGRRNGVTNPESFIIVIEHPQTPSTGHFHVKTMYPLVQKRMLTSDYFVTEYHE